MRGFDRPVHIPVHIKVRPRLTWHGLSGLTDGRQGNLFRKRFRRSAHLQRFGATGSRRFRRDGLLRLRFVRFRFENSRGYAVGRRSSAPPPVAVADERDPDLFRYMILHRARMRLLLSEAELGQYFKDLVRGHL